MMVGIIRVFLQSIFDNNPSSGMLANLSVSIKAAGQRLQSEAIIRTLSAQLSLQYPSFL
jgi:hypothetical protein